MGRKYQAISADGHLETPPDAWMKHVPERYKERAPRLIPLEDGGEAWLVEGMPLMQNGPNLAAGTPKIYSNASYWDDKGNPRPGTGTAQQRLAEQDLDGIDAEVLFPPVFASRFIESIADKRAYRAMVRAYNEFLAEYCAVAPDRLIGNGIIPTSGIDDALAELKFCKELGLRSVSPGNFPNGTTYIRPEHDDRFWELALELDMRISPHASIGDQAVKDDGPNFVDVARRPGVAPLDHQLSRYQPGPMWGINQLIVSGTFNRFPELKVYIAETDAGWLPFALQRLDKHFEDNEHLFPDHQLKMKPSEYVRQNFMLSFIRDPMAMKLRDFLPAEILMWGTDFPHAAGSFPQSRKWLDINFEGVPASLKRQILLENPANYFGLDLDADITETPAG